MKLIKLFVLLLFFGACANSGDDFKVSGEVIQIQFTSNIKEGDWFKLDEVEFNHVLNDTTDMLNQPNLNHFAYFESSTQEFVEKGYLPVSRLYFHMEGQKDSEKVPPGRVAGMFIQRLYQKQAALKDGDLIYQLGQAEFLILSGKVFVKRSDDKPIRVTSNTENGIYFKVLSKEDKLYKDLFEK